MQHLWEFLVTIEGKDFTGTLLTDKSRKSKIPKLIYKEYLVEEDKVSSLWIRMIR